ncbi:MAG: holo-ACP synthase [Planctomycetota bacterium]
MIVGHGVDLVEVARIHRSIDRFGDRFLERVFTENERRYAADRARRLEHLAARFAAKEAVLKALGTGWSGGIAWTDVEVTRDAAGRPGVALHNLAAEHARRLDAKRWTLSISHTDTHAMASAIAEG